MPTYRLDKETRELISKDEWIEKYGEDDKVRGITIINRSFEAYESPITGEIISSHRRRDEDMRANGCVDYETSLKKEIDQGVLVNEQKLENQMESEIESHIRELPTQKREKLVTELESGLDISLERQ